MEVEHRPWRLFRRDSSSFGGRLRLLTIAVSTVAVAACSAVYPEIATPLRPPPKGRVLSPPPPDDLVYIQFKSAEIPRKTRDGRQWDALGGKAPDPFAIIFLDDKELLRTPVQSNTLNPTWPSQKKENYKVPSGSRIRVELWDSNPINNHPICVRKLSSFTTETDEDGVVSLRCNSGARVELVVEPARPRVGLGFYYELRTRDIFVTRVITESPAGRAKLESGDQLVKIQGKETRDMEEGEARSLVNANSPVGVTLTIKKKKGGDLVDLTLKDGPIYATASDGVKLE